MEPPIIARWHLDQERCKSFVNFPTVCSSMVLWNTPKKRLILWYLLLARGFHCQAQFIADSIIHVNQPTSFGHQLSKEFPDTRRLSLSIKNGSGTLSPRQDGTNVANITKSDVKRNSRKLETEFLLGNLFRFLQGLRGMSPFTSLKKLDKTEK